MMPLTSSSTLFVGYTNLTLIIGLAERFQMVNGQDAQTAALHLLPLLGGSAFGCFVCGPINKKKNRTSTILMASCTSMLVGSAMLTTPQQGVHDPLTLQYVAQTIFGLGFGLFMTAGCMIASVHAPLGDHAVALGAVAQARVFGGSVGLAVAAIISNIHVQDDLAGQLTADQLAALRRSPLEFLAAWPDLQVQLRGTYAAAFATTWQVVAIVAAAAMIASLFAYERNPPPLNTKFVATGDEEAPHAVVMPGNNKSRRISHDKEKEWTDPRGNFVLGALEEALKKPSIPNRVLARQHINAYGTLAPLTCAVRPEVYQYPMPQEFQTSGFQTSEK